MKRQHIFWIALFLYVVSFFLVAIAFPIPQSGRVRGYDCAFSALLLSLDPNSFARDEGVFRGGLLEHISLFISGWINLAFLITAAFGLLSNHKRPFNILRVIVVLMIPFCWIVFYEESIYPREGHFVWIIGMLLVLFSGGLAKATNSGAEAQN